MFLEKRYIFGVLIKQYFFMKKILLSCLLACGLGANAQTVIFSDDFESTADGTIGNWEEGFFGTLAAYPYNTFTVRGNCAANLINGTKSLQIVNVADAAQDADLTTASCAYGNGSATNASYAPLVYTQIAASDYKDLKLSYVWKCQGQASSDYGQLMYSLDGLSWTSVVSNLRSGTAPYQTVVTDYALPAAVNFKTFYLGWRFVHNTSTVNQPGFTIDDVVVKGTMPSAVPACSSITSPVNSSTVNYGSVNFTWAASADASKYKLAVGTTPGGSDVFSGTVTGLTQAVSLNANTTYYAQVVPTNNVGDAVGCAEITFSTNNTIGYCAAAGSNAQYEKITNVIFADINNPSAAGTTAQGYEDFTSIVGNVNRENTYVFTGACSVSTYPTDQLLVWIDYNQNGIFNDPGEAVLSTALGQAPWTGSITIPADALLGNTRMRVRVQDSSAGANATSCGNSSYGQVEDYTINIMEKITAGTANVDKNSVSVYPNPFKEVLKISDVKGVKSISVSDAAGRSIKTLAAASELNLSDLKAGLYIVTLHMEDGSTKSIKAIRK